MFTAAPAVVEQFNQTPAAQVLKDTGVIEKLEQMGINEGDTVSIFDFEFDYVK